MMKPEAAAAALPDDGLDPEIRQFVRLMSQRWRQHPPLDRVPVQEARRIAEQVRSHWTQGGPQMASDRAFAEASRWLSDMLRTDAPAERAR